MKGFTIIELIISIAIFAFMTALVVAKYGTFNQNTLLTNTAYDLALTVRTAQSYGLGVKSVDGSNTFAPYGVRFDMSKTAQFILFADKNLDSKYGGDAESVTTYTLNSGVTISSICLGSSLSDCAPDSFNLLGGSDTLDVTYRRPNPDAIFLCSGSGGICPVNNGPVFTFITKPVAIVTLISSDKTSKQYVYIRRNGEISVGN